MICPKCGAVLSDDASRCFDCGMSFRPAASDDMSSLKGVFSTDEELKVKTYYRRRAARDPLGKFKTCQLLLLAGYVILIAIYLYLISIVKKLFTSSDVNVDSLNSLNTITIIVSIGVIVAAIGAVVMLSKLRDCNYSFELAFKFMIASLIIQVVYNILDERIESIAFLLLLAAAKMVVGFFYVYFFCQGAAELCMPDSPRLERRWQLFWKISLAIDIAAIIYCIVLVARVKGAVSDYDSLYDAVLAALTFVQRMVVAATIVDVVVSLFMVLTISDTIDMLNTLPEPESIKNDQKSLFGPL